MVANGSPPHMFESLDSIKDIVAEIVVVDIGLDTAVKEKIGKRYGVKFVSPKGSLPYVELIREQSKTYAKYDYVLFLDPDEVFPKKLSEIISKEYALYDFLRIPRQNILFGKWIAHSRWWPDYQVRLFKKESVTWPNKIHKQPVLVGKGHDVPAEEPYAIIHHNYENIDEYLSKAMRYAKNEASEMILDHKPFVLADAVSKALTEFVSRFFAAEGYKDGMHGFALAMLQMFYSFLVYFYYWEEKGYENQLQDETVRAAHVYFKRGLYESNHWMAKKGLLRGIQNIKTTIVNRFIR